MLVSFLSPRRRARGGASPPFAGRWAGFSAFAKTGGGIGGAPRSRDWPPPPTLQHRPLGPFAGSWAKMRACQRERRSRAAQGPSKRRPRSPSSSAAPHVREGWSTSTGPGAPGCRSLMRQSVAGVESACVPTAFLFPLLSADVPPEKRLGLAASLLARLPGRRSCPPIGRARRQGAAGLPSRDPEGDGGAGARG